MPSVTFLFFLFSFVAAGLVMLSSHVILSKSENQHPQSKGLVSLEASPSHYLEQLSSFASSFNMKADMAVSHLLFTRPVRPVTIAYAITIQEKCEGDWIDSALVLRHSIHLTSVRGNAQSVYDYRMIAIIHESAESSCSQLLHHAGYQVIVKASPVMADEIVDGYLKKKKDHSGTTDLFPLHVYQLTEYPIVVALDLQSLIIKPLDDIYDAMLYHPSSFIGRAARQKVHLEFPKSSLPDNIQAVITKDWPLIMPGRKPGVRPGFVVVKPNRDVFDLMVDVVRRGDFVSGFSRENGWGGLGYGGIPGDLGTAGLLAYVYEAILYDTVVEVNQCRYNHIGMDVLYRASPSFKKKHPKVGKCRNDQKFCEDCMATPLHDIYTVQFSQCPRPWHCIAEGSRTRPDDKTAVHEDQVSLEHCFQLMGIWHGVRTDFEMKLYNLTAAESIRSAQDGKYAPRVFSGHCLAYGEQGYMKIAGTVRTMQRIPDLYK